MSNLTPKSMSRFSVCQCICLPDRKCVNTVISVDRKRQSVHAHAYSILRVFTNTDKTETHINSACFGSPKTRFIMSYLLTIEVIAANIGLRWPCFCLQSLVEMDLYSPQRNIVLLIAVRTNVCKCCLSRDSDLCSQIPLYV